MNLYDNAKLMMTSILTQLYNSEEVAKNELKDCKIKIVSIAMGTSDKFEFYCYTKGKTHRVINDNKGLNHTVSLN